jgi:hypothetical protein
LHLFWFLSKTSSSLPFYTELRPLSPVRLLSFEAPLD